MGLYLSALSRTVLHPHLIKHKPWLHSQKSSPLTLWLPSMSLLKNGQNWVITSPRPLASPWPRLLLVLLNLTINIAVSMLVMKILTLTLLMFSTPSFTNTMVLVLISSTPLTWTPAKSLPTLNQMFPFTPAESVSAVQSKDLVFPLASLNNNVLMLRPS